MAGFSISLFKNDSDHSLTANSITFKNLMTQLAANIIHSCEVYPNDGRTPKDSGIAQVLAIRFEWKDQDFINPLQAQVELLYAYVKALLELSKENLPLLRTILTGKEALLFSEALMSYQDWKTALCQHEQKIHGENWKIDTGFFKADWSDQNTPFLALFK